MNKSTVLYLGVFCAVALFADEAFARDLASATSNYTSIVTRVAQGLSVSGVAAGAGIMAIPGASDWGKRIMAGGAVGTLAAFGAPSFVGLIQQVFGQ